MDCGAEDIGEQAICCPGCDIGYPGCSEKLCAQHLAAARAQKTCPEPGSGRFDPYRRRT